MKALTICCPWPWFIFTPAEELASWLAEPKRIENRSWETLYRGPLLIHAGASKAWMKPYWDWQLPPQQFSAIIGVVDLVKCWNRSSSNMPDWIPDHQHTDEGSQFWWELANPRKFDEPIPYGGKQGLFNIPDNVVTEAIARCGQVGQVV
jgi:hypothetical protein